MQILDLGFTLLCSKISLKVSPCWDLFNYLVEYRTCLQQLQTRKIELAIETAIQEANVCLGQGAWECTGEGYMDSVYYECRCLSTL